MKKRSLCLALLLGFFMITGCSKAPVQESETIPTVLTIEAAASLKNAMTDISQAFMQEYGDIELIFNYGGSGDLEKQIENATGDEFDFFISAAQKQMDELEKKELINASSRKNLVENKLVLIAPKDSVSEPSLDALLDPSVEYIAIGEPETVPAGEYGMEALEALEIYPQIKDKLVYAKDATQVLTYVEQGEAQLGIVYQTDAASSSSVVVLADFPADSYSPIIYPMAILSESVHQEQAEIFEDFLSGERAAKILSEYGFTPLTQE